MGQLRKKKVNREDDDLMDALEKASAWAMITVTTNEDKENSSTLAIRESSKDMLIDLIVVLLEHPEIYDLVQKKIAENKLNDSSKQPPNTNVN